MEICIELSGSEDGEEVEAEVQESLLRLSETVATGCPRPAEGVVDSGDPIAHVIFFGTPTSQSYRSKFERLFNHFLQSCLGDGSDSSDDEQEDDSGMSYQHNAVSVVGGRCSDAVECTCGRQKYIVSGCVEYYSGYVMDWMGIAMTDREGELVLPEEFRVVYEQVYTQAFWADAHTQQEEKRLRKMLIRCFNCGDYHHMRDCSEPINPFHVAYNRRQYQESVGIATADKRYHVELANDRFSKFEPGKISQQLKIAMGLDEGEIPSYIQKMHQLGYPPGWRALHEDVLKMFVEPGQEIPFHLVPKAIVYPGYNDPLTHSEPFPVEVEEKEESPVLVSMAVEVKDTSDLVELSDFEFEEEGEEFGLRILTRGHHNPVEHTKHFSLDFPPGLVHPLEECEPPKNRWRDLLQIIEGSKKPQVNRT